MYTTGASWRNVFYKIFTFGLWEINHLETEHNYNGTVLCSRGKRWVRCKLFLRSLQWERWEMSAHNVTYEEVWTENHGGGEDLLIFLWCSTCSQPWILIRLERAKDLGMLKTNNGKIMVVFFFNFSVKNGHWDYGWYVLSWAVCKGCFTYKLECKLPRSSSTPRQPFV